MTTTTETSAPPRQATLRLAGVLLQSAGLIADAELRAFALTLTHGKPSRSPGDFLAKIVRPLLDDEVVVRRGDTWYAPSMADLAAWVADGWEAREAAGYLDDPDVPPVPVQRSRVA